MGTGSRTSLPMVDRRRDGGRLGRVKIVQAPGDEPKYGNQDTDGSRSMRHHIQPMRQIGASVRQMLEQAAAAQWGVEVGRGAGAVNHEVVAQVARATSSAMASWRRPRWRLPVPPGEQLQVQGRERVPLHRQGRGADLRPARHHHRQGGLCRRRPAARTCSTRSSRGRRWSAARSSRSTLGRARRCRASIKVVPDRRHRRCRPSSRRSAASRWSPRTPGRRSRAATRSRSNGTTARTRPTTPAQYRARRCRRPRAKPGKVVRNQGDVDAAFAGAAKTFTARVLSAAHGPRADGAAGGAGQRHRRQVRRLGAACRAPAARATMSPSCSACRSRT